MKSIQELLGDTKPKNVAKILKAFTKGGSEQYKDAFMAEVFNPTARDFQENKCIVTENFIGDYSLYAGLGGMIRVIPLNKVVNLYRTNVTLSGGKIEYNFDAFNLAVELDDNDRMFIAQMTKTVKSMDAYNDLIAYIRSRISSINGGATC